MTEKKREWVTGEKERKKLQRKWGERDRDNEKEGERDSSLPRDENRKFIS